MSHAEPSPNCATLTAGNLHRSPVKSFGKLPYFTLTLAMHGYGKAAIARGVSIGLSECQGSLAFGAYSPDSERLTYTWDHWRQWPARCSYPL